MKAHCDHLNVFKPALTEVRIIKPDHYAFDFHIQTDTGSQALFILVEFITSAKMKKFREGILECGVYPLHIVIGMYKLNEIAQDMGIQGIAPYKIIAEIHIAILRHPNMGRIFVLHGGSDKPCNPC
jgi:hypothetical protein